MTREKKIVPEIKKDFCLNWNWLFSKCPAIFLSLVMLGFIVFLFWLF